ncbi:MAG: thioredoxin domain-containing protein [Longimicrobiales bacterium]
MIRLPSFTQVVAVVAVFGGSAMGGSAWRASAGAVRVEPLAAPIAFLPEDGALRRGPGGAPAVHVFGDYECPSCRAFEARAGKALRALADAGRLHLVYHDATLSAHRWGNAAAAAVHCAVRDENGKRLDDEPDDPMQPMDERGWMVHDAIYEQAAEWKQAADPPAAIARSAAEAMGDGGGEKPSGIARLEDCMAGEHTWSVLREARDRARRAGIHEVPAVIAGGQRLRFTSYRSLVRYVTKRVATP